MTKYTLRRLFVYVTTAAIVCGFFVSIYKLTGVPDFHFISCCWHADWLNGNPPNVPETMSGFITMIVLISLAAGIVGLVGHVLIWGGVMLLMIIWIKAMEWSAVPDK